MNKDLFVGPRERLRDYSDKELYILKFLHELCVNSGMATKELVRAANSYQSFYMNLPVGADLTMVSNEIQMLLPMNVEGVSNDA